MIIFLLRFSDFNAREAPRGECKKGWMNIRIALCFHYLVECYLDYCIFFRWQFREGMGKNFVNICVLQWREIRLLQRLKLNYNFTLSTCLQSYYSIFNSLITAINKFVLIWLRHEWISWQDRTKTSKYRTVRINSSW